MLSHDENSKKSHDNSSLKITSQEMLNNEQSSKMEIGTMNINIALVVILAVVVCSGIASERMENPRGTGLIFLVSLLFLITVGLVKCNEGHMQESISGNIGNGIVQLSGTRENKCLKNLSTEILSVRTVFHGNHGAEYTASVFMLKADESVCGFEGGEVYITNLSGALLGWKRME